MRIIADPAKLKAAQTYDAASDHFDDEPLGFSLLRQIRYSNLKLSLEPPVMKRKKKRNNEVHRRSGCLRK